MRKIREKLIVILILCLVMLTGCTDKDGKEVLKEEESKIKIGLSFDSLVIERWYREQDAFVAQATELGAQVYVQNANGEVAKQIEQIQYFIKNDMDAIVVIAIDGDALTPVISKAKEAGIKVIAYDRLINNANADLYISFDNAEIGQLLTNELLENTKENGNVIAIFGPYTDNNAKIIETEFNKLVADKKINIVKRVYAKNWKSEEAFYAVSSWINQGNEVDTVFCGNDDLAGEAIRALAEKRMAGKVCVIGQDGDLSACQRVVEGTQEMTIYKDVIKMAKLAAQYAVDLVNHKEIEGMETINDGSYEIPCYLLNPIKVTKENMDEVIIKSGFHQREEVYLNIMENQE